MNSMETSDPGAAVMEKMKRSLLVSGLCGLLVAPGVMAAEFGNHDQDTYPLHKAVVIPSHEADTVSGQWWKASIKATRLGGKGHSSR